MKPKFLFFVVLAVLLTVLVSVLIFKLFLNKSVQPMGQNGEIQVATSFYPLYFFTSQIGSEFVQVSNLTPAGAEPHDFEPNAQDVARLENVKLLIINGAGLEPWGDNVTANLKEKKIKVIAVAENLANKQLDEDGEMMRDPHVWLDPILAKQEVTQITEALAEVDPAHKADFEKNSAQLLTKLDVLDQEFRQGLSQCNQKSIVTSHQAFGYLAQRYGLSQFAISGISPDQEPSPSQLADIATFTKQNNVKYIFFETLVSPRLAETLAKEVGASTLVFDPLEGLSTEDQQAGLDYFSVQRQNLANLKIALECK